LIWFKIKTGHVLIERKFLKQTGLRKILVFRSDSSHNKFRKKHFQANLGFQFIHLKFQKTLKKIFSQISNLTQMEWFRKMEVKIKTFDSRWEILFSLENWLISRKNEEKILAQKKFFPQKSHQKKFKVHFYHFEKSFRNFFFLTWNFPQKICLISFLLQRNSCPLWFWMNLFFLPST